MKILEQPRPEIVPPLVNLQSHRIWLSSVEAALSVHG